MAYRQSKTAASDASATTIAATFDSAVQAGNVIVVGFNWDSAAESVTSVADGLSNTYNLIGAGTVATNNNQSFRSYYAQNINAGTCTVTVTFLGSRDFRRLVIGEYSGRAASAFDQSSVTDSGLLATGTDGCQTSSITPTQANEDIIGMFMCDTTLTLAAGTGYTQRDVAQVSNVADMQLEDLTQGAAAAITAKWTVSGVGSGTEFCASVFSLKAGAADTGLAWIKA